MSKTLTEIAQQLKDVDKKVQLIYAFNGGGKTRLSREFKKLVEADSSGDESNDDTEHSELSQKHILYYSAFTEDLFYWDNDLSGDEERKLKIHSNSFTNWVFDEQDQTTEFLLYTAPNGAIKVEVLLSNETIWLTQERMAELFGVQRPAITKHLKNIFESNELQEDVVCSILEHTTDHGAIAGKTQTRRVKSPSFPRSRVGTHTERK